MVQWDDFCRGWLVSQAIHWPLVQSTPGSPPAKVAFFHSTTLILYNVDLVFWEDEVVRCMLTLKYAKARLVVFVIVGYRHPLRQASSENIWRPTLEKAPTNFASSHDSALWKEASFILWLLPWLGRQRWWLVGWKGLRRGRWTYHKQKYVFFCILYFVL